MNRARIFTEFLAHSGEPSSRVRTLQIYTGTPVYRFDFWTGKEWFLRLSMEPGSVDLGRLDRAPVLKDHNRATDSVVGALENPRLENGVLLADARFSETESTAEVWQKIQEGVLRNVSVEASIAKQEKTSDKIDGLPVYLATKWEPEAVALVAVGADRHAQIMSAFDPQDAHEQVLAAVRAAVDEQLAPMREELKRAYRILGLTYGNFPAR